MKDLSRRTTCSSLSSSRRGEGAPSRCHRRCHHVGVVGVVCGLPRLVLQLLLLLLLLSCFVLVSAQSPSQSPAGGEGGTGEEGCNICQEVGQVLGNPDEGVQDPINGRNLTCGELEDEAAAGAFNALQCTIIQFAVSASCKCDSPKSNSSSTNSSTSISESPSPAPQQQQPSPPTNESTPTIGRNISTRIQVELSGNLTDIMSTDEMVFFEQQTCDFFSSQATVADVIAGSEDNVSLPLKCLVLEQALEANSSSATNSSSQRRGYRWLSRRRILQTGLGESVLSTLLRVDAQSVNSGLTSTEFSSLLSGTIEENPDDYALSLSSSDFPYFDAVTSASAFAAVPGSPSSAPVPVPETASDVPSGVPTFGPTTLTPQSSPTLTPTVTIAPIDLFPPTPTPSTSAAPSVGNNQPTTPSVSVSGTVSVLLQYVVGQMGEFYATAFEDQTTVFLSEQLAAVSPPVTDISTSLLNQTTGEVMVTIDNLRPLTAIVNVEGKRQDSSSGTDISQLVADTMNKYSTDYLLTLREDSESAAVQVYFKSVVTLAATVYTATPAPAPTATDAPGGSSTSSGGGGLSGGAIAGIVIGVLLFLVLGAVIFFNAVGKDRKHDGMQPVASLDSFNYANDGGGPPSSVPNPATANNAAALGGGTGGVNQRPPLSLSNTTAASTFRPSGVPEKEVPPPFSEDDESYRSESFLGPTMTAEDAASYAYSLEAGTLKANPTDGAASTFTDVGAGGAGANDMDIPIEEVKIRKYKRTVVAPAGKLGIIIDTTLEGPVVYKVNPSSPLDGVIFPGDLIVMIDDIETRAMSAANITALMVETAGKQRTLTVLSEDPHR